MRLEIEFTRHDLLLILALGVVVVLPVGYHIHRDSQVQILLAEQAKSPNQGSAVARDIKAYVRSHRNLQSKPYSPQDQGPE